MSVPFVVLVFIALVLLAFWRITLLIVFALLLAMFLFGAGHVAEGLAGLSTGLDLTAPGGGVG
jgi:hypothetical protein